MSQFEAILACVLVSALGAYTLFVWNPGKKSLNWRCRFALAMVCLWTAVVGVPLSIKFYSDGASLIASIACAIGLGVLISSGIAAFAGFAIGIQVLVDRIERIVRWFFGPAGTDDE
ncbi:MAG: hypothetical protein AAFY08_12315 [Planctomycetota bacterium]